MGRARSNPRQSKRGARLRAAARFAAADAPCALCRGRRGPIHYGEPRDHLHPLSLVIDEIAPVSRWSEFGYTSARECARDESNWQPAHRICNAEASDKRRPQRRAHDRPSGAF